jgi:hypothetical protein
MGLDFREVAYWITLLAAVVWAVYGTLNATVLFVFFSKFGTEGFTFGDILHAIALLVCPMIVILGLLLGWRKDRLECRQKSSEAAA